MAIALKDLDDLTTIGPGTVKLLVRLEALNHRVAKHSEDSAQRSKDLQERLYRFEEYADRLDSRSAALEQQLQQAELALRAQLVQMNHSLHILATVAVSFLEDRSPGKRPELRLEPLDPPIDRRRRRAAPPPPAPAAPKDAVEELGEYFLQVLRASDPAS
jgi:hypothetical protein